MMKRLKCGVFGLVALFFIMSFSSADFIGSFTCTDSDTTCGKIKAPSDCVNSFSVYFDGGGKPFTVYRNGGNSAYLEFYSGLVTSDCSYIEISGTPGFISTTYPFNVNYGSDPNGGNCPDCPSCPTCPEINTGDILSGYILESEIDNLYCENHGYCPIIDTGSIESGNWSALFINDIQHVSAPLINITIPEEFDWNYTGNDEEFDLSISGYNVDTEYIDGIIRNQTTLPNSTDFNNTVSGLIPLFVPGLVIILLIYFIFRFIKKIF